MKSNFFNPLQLKHLMAHKGSCLKAIATPEGLRLCPDFAQNIIHVLDPVPVKMDTSDIRNADDGRNITYMIEDGYQIAKLADALDFTKAEVAKYGDCLDFVVGKKHFPMKLFSASEPYFDLNLEGYKGTVEWDAAGSEAMQICNIASFEIGTAREFLQGVFIDPEDMFVATDGYRMIYHKSCKALGLEEFLKAHPSKCADNTFIMPAWTIPYLDGYTKVFYAYHDVEAVDSDHYPLHTPWSYWKLETGGETYLFIPIEGQFPKWRKVAPEYLNPDDTGYHYEHKKTVFDFEGMKRYKKTGKHDSLLCRFHDDTCTQMYNGEIELDIGVKFPLPEDIDVYFNAQYLIDGVKVFGKQAEVEISLPDPDEGHIMKAVDIVGKHDLLHYVVMPRRAN